MKKVAIIGMICMLVTPAMATTEITDHTSFINRNENDKTLYVGGSRPDNYTSIQAAVDDSSDGDTVFVYDDMSPYRENVMINTSIHLVGEGRNTTVIDGGKKSNVISVWADNVTIRHFTLQNGGLGWELWELGSGIYAESNGSRFYENVLENNRIGIWLHYGHGNNINDNRIDNSGSVWVQGENNVVSYNFISHAQKGIAIEGKHIQVVRNTVTRTRWGVFVRGEMTNRSLKGGFHQIHYNNLILNVFHAGFYLDDDYRMTDIVHLANWSNNYWGRPMIFPKPIIGFGDYVDNYVPEMVLFNCDWHPAREPIEWRST